MTLFLDLSSLLSEILLFLRGVLWCPVLGASRHTAMCLAKDMQETQRSMRQPLNQCYKYTPEARCHSPMLLVPETTDGHLDVTVMTPC